MITRTKLLATTFAVGGLLAALSQLGVRAATEASPPDLNGFWTHGFSLGFQAPPEGGPGPVQDFKTLAQMRAMGQFVVHEGNYNNPILQPWAAARVKESGELSKAGKRIPTKQETCFPSGVP